MPDGGASLFASIASALGASGTAAAGTAGAVTAGTTAAAATGTAAAVGAGASVGTAAAAAGGLTALEIASLAGAATGVAGSAAQLLAEKPKLPNLPGAPSRDDAQAEADQRSELYKRRGRAAALLTKGGAAGDTSSPSLGAAQLLGA